MELEFLLGTANSNKIWDNLELNNNKLQRLELVVVIWSSLL